MGQQPWVIGAVLTKSSAVKRRGFIRPSFVGLMHVGFGEMHAV
jgi:hypothetical protein